MYDGQRQHLSLCPAAPNPHQGVTEREQQTENLAEKDAHTYAVDDHQSTVATLCSSSLSIAKTRMKKHYVLGKCPQANSPATHTHTRTHTDAHTRTHTHGRTHAHTHARTHTHTYARAHTHTHTHTDAHTHTHTHTCTHTRTHTHTHTHTLQMQKYLVILLFTIC